MIFGDEFEYVNNIYFLKLDEMIFLLVIIKVCKIRSKWLFENKMVEIFE